MECVSEFFIFYNLTMIIRCSFLTVCGKIGIQPCILKSILTFTGSRTYTAMHR